VHKYFDMPLRRFLTRHLIQVKNEKWKSLLQVAAHRLT
jgi:hypothetical protein